MTSKFALLASLVLTGFGITKGCSDKDEHCPYWASLGYCKVPIYQKYLEHTCTKSCNNCLPACGKIIESNRIVGGETAELNEIPWQVALVTSFPSEVYKKPFCGGTIICPSFILSAAHCTIILGHKAEYMDVLVGEHDWTNDLDDAERHHLENVIPHGDYRGQPNFDYDFSILKLKEPIVLDGWSRVAACLPSPEDKDFEEGTEFVVSGWGSTINLDSEAEVKEQPEQLMHALVHSCSPADTECGQCPNSPWKICHRTNEGIGSCKGDSGGPMTWLDPKTSVVKLVGVCSYGIPNRLPNGEYSCAGNDPDQYPSVYARVTSVLSWIKTSTDDCANEFL